MESSRAQQLVASFLELRACQVYVQLLVRLQGLHMILRHHTLFDWYEVDFVPSSSIMPGILLKIILNNFLRRVLHFSNKIRINYSSTFLN